MQDFTDEERVRIRALLQYDAEFKEMMVLRGAKAVVFRTYRTVIIGTAGLLVAAATLWDQLIAVLRGVIR